MTNTDEHGRTRTFLRILFALALCACAWGQDISVLPDDEGVAAEDAALDALISTRGSRTTATLALADRIGSNDYGLRYCSEVLEPGRLRVFAAPIRWDDAGTMRPVDPRWRYVGDTHPNYTFASLQGETIVGLDVQGWRHIKGPGFHLRTRPAGVYVGQTVFATTETVFPVKRVNADRLRVDGLWPAAIPSFYQVTANGVKEGLLLPQALRDNVPAQATWVRFRYAYERLSGTMTAELSEDNSTVRLIDNGAVVGILPTPWAQDAAGAREYGGYQLGAGWLEVAIPAAWLRDEARVWPILVDPTVTAVGSGDYLSVRDTTGSPDYYVEWYAKFDLPDIGAGSTFDGAAFYAYKTGGENWTVNLRTSADATWTTASSAATMQALGVFGSVSITASTAGWNTWSGIGGTSGDANSIAKMYSDAGSNPGEVTIKCYTAIASPAGIPPSSFFTFEDEGAANSLSFTNVDGGANEPYVEITYTAGASSGPARRSGSVGMIMN